MPLPGVTRRELARTYDVVVIGGGVQGLALAYELARHGVRRVAVLERAWPGCGASGRNGELIRSVFSSDAWAGLFDHSLRRWHGLSAELDYNVLFRPAGYLVAAADEARVARCAADAQANRRRGIDCRFVTGDELRALMPAAAPEAARGGLYQPDGGFAHHDAVVWAYLQAAARLGVEVHAGVEVTAIERRGEGERLGRLRTSSGDLAAPVVVNAAGAGAARVNGLAGVELPLEVARLEILVTEPIAPFLTPGVAALDLFGYCHQTSRGEFVGGTERPPGDHTDSLSCTWDLLRDMARKFTWMFPVLGGARLLRHWAGTVSQTADLAPAIGPLPELDGYWVTCGWVYGFMGAPGAAELLAEAIVTGQVPALLEPFGAERLRTGRLIHEASLVVPGAGDRDIEAVK